VAMHCALGLRQRAVSSAAWWGERPAVTAVDRLAGLGSRVRVSVGPRVRGRGRGRDRVCSGASAVTAVDRLAGKVTHYVSNQAGTVCDAGARHLPTHSPTDEYD